MSSTPKSRLARHLAEIDPKRGLVRLIQTLARRHRIEQVFRDLVAICALSISNTVDRSEYDKREAEYLAIVARYNREEIELFVQAFAMITFGLESGLQDFLGSVFMTLELGNHWSGQYFTPYPVCVLMAKLTVGDGAAAAAAIAQRGFVSVNDPCVGGGAMVIAAAQALEDAGWNYQQRMHVTAQDIDIVAVHMAYVQLALLHIPAVVIHGNSLMVEQRSCWRTPAHVVGGWEQRIVMAQEAGTLPRAPSTAGGEGGLAEAAAVDVACVVSQAEERDSLDAMPTQEPRPAKAQAQQFSLF